MMLKRVICIIFLVDFIKFTKQVDNTGKFIHFDPNNQSIHAFNCHLDDELMNTMLTRSTQLKEIYIQHCYIPVLENVVFLKFPNLITLEISDSQLTNIEDFALNGLKFLKYLNLARNNLTELKSWSVMELRGLISIDMRRNQLHEIDAKNFQRYPNLQKLNFAVNYISDIKPETFRPLMNHLKYLNLGRNLLTKITTQTFQGLIKLSNLALHFNQIEHIDEMAFETNTHLKTLRLEGNRITTLNFMHILSLGRLVHFNISYNNVESLEQFSFAKDFELRDLDISYNHIKELNENTLTGLQSLEIFNASHNQISTIHNKTFNELTSLTHLDVSANNLEVFDGNYFNCNLELEYLNLSSNNIQDMNPKVFIDLRNLQVLDLSYNKFEHDNFLTNIQTHLEYLNLCQNQYNTINISMLHNINLVNLEGNPWHCDWLLKQYLNTPRNIHFGANYTLELEENHTLDMPGVECFNGAKWKSLVFIKQIKEIETGKVVTNSTVQKTIIYNFKLDRFDHKSVAIWLIISVFIFMSIARVAKMFLDRSEKRNRNGAQSSRANNNNYEEVPMEQQGNHQNANKSECETHPCIPNCEYQNP